MKSNRKHWIGLGSVLLLVFLTVNCVIIFKEDSKIARSYYITDYERVALEQQRAYIEKEAMLIPHEEIRITADANALSQISVRPGQKISANEEIAAYKTEEATQEQSKIQSEVNAYESELTTLEGILRRLEAQDINDPVTTIDSEQIDDELSITVETEIMQGTPVEAIASIEKQIAEVERNIAILEDRISDLSFSNVLSSPIDGVIGEVIDESGAITFIIYTDQKNLITYVSEQEWEKVAENQSVELDQSIFDTVAEHEGLTNAEDTSSSVEPQVEILGTIVEKQTIPATSSLWYREMEKVVKLPEPLSFEVRVDLNEEVVNKPYASLTKAKVIINETPSAFRVDKNWVLKKKIADDKETKEATFVYAIDVDGKIRSSIVDVAFEDRGEAILSGISNGSIVLYDQIKNEPSNAFFPMPFETPSKSTLNELNWKQYAKYIIF
ncbi:efflux RND transporter periplasmic adaptor subunit [Ureibacillus chungkukjangi]|uniref:Macrolide-specific efflux system membrane fusion protein n=1 Tax=Ureibacillus chungkukjangi TaxID=1202712 RepID=A0A318TVL0_9BACL|nr:hypothetical protein [Ureibacillus chungkukjangi]PYF08782.1 macrolide-specific efflux system membrane fusion protein [Ureibacillus chungkukjangi]